MTTERVREKIASLKFSANPRDWSLADTMQAMLERIEELERANAESNHRIGEYVDKTAELEAKNKALREALMAVKGFCRHCGASYPHRCGEGRCRRCGVLANLDKMTSKCE